MKTLSIKQPFATLVCAGVKKVENRTWKTDYRGRLLIHASGDANAYPDLDCLPSGFADKAVAYSEGKLEGTESVKNYDRLLDRAYIFYQQDVKQQEAPQNWLRDAVKKHGFFMPSQAVIGEATLDDIVTGSDDDFAEHGCFHWIMSNAVLYEKPVINVMGHLRLWNFEKP
jgi:hypothetical protein